MRIIKMFPGYMNGDYSSDHVSILATRRLRALWFLLKIPDYLDDEVLDNEAFA